MICFHICFIMKTVMLKSSCELRQVSCCQFRDFSFIKCTSFIRNVDKMLITETLNDAWTKFPISDIITQLNTKLNWYPFYTFSVKFKDIYIVMYHATDNISKERLVWIICSVCDVFSELSLQNNRTPLRKCKLKHFLFL